MNTRNDLVNYINENYRHKKSVKLHLKKEENLKDYEDMLYSDDYLADYMPKDEGCCCEDEGCECADEDCGDDDCCCDENPQE